MQKNSFYLIILLVSALLMSGCNLKDAFPRFTASNESPGAKDQHIKSQIFEMKQKRIEEKKRQFSQMTELTKINESDPYEAYFFFSNSDEVVQIELEAILPNPGRQIYELWLRNPSTKEIKNLGALRFNQTDDYVLSHSDRLDLEAFTNIILTRESNPDNQLETIIMTGSLTTSTP